MAISDRLTFGSLPIGTVLVPMATHGYMQLDDTFATMIVAEQSKGKRKNKTGLLLTRGHETRHIIIYSSIPFRNVAWQLAK